MEREPLKHGSKGGRFREVYVVGPEGKHIAKLPRPIIHKKYPFGTVPMPGPAYTLLKFGNTNINKVEFENYKALPNSVRDVYTPKCRLIKGVLIEERVFDGDGTPSRSIDEHIAAGETLDNEHFWKEVDTLRETLLADKAYLLGVFYGGSNIMVQKISPEVWKPVMVDFKRLGRRSYPFQPHLWSDANLEKKFLRQFERFERAHRPKSLAETPHVSNEPEPV